MELGLEVAVAFCLEKFRNKSKKKRASSDDYERAQINSVTRRVFFFFLNKGVKG